MAKKKVIPRVPRTRGAGTLTESQYFGKIRSALRNIFRYWPPIQEALKAASRPSQSKTNKLLKTEYQCAQCKNWFKRTEVEVDHIVECGSLSSYDHIVPFIQRLSIENIDGFQILCKPCHIIKSKNYIKNKN